MTSPRRIAVPLAALSLLALLLCAAPAGAATTTTYRPLLFRFKGADSSTGEFSPYMKLALDSASGNVYMLNPIGTPGTICKFNAAGEAEDFANPASSPGPDSCLRGTGTAAPWIGSNAEIAVDNSGGPRQGRIYLTPHSSGSSSGVYAFAPDGSFLWEIPPSAFAGIGKGVAENVKVSADGDLWVSVGSEQEPGVPAVPTNPIFLLRFGGGDPPSLLETVPISDQNYFPSPTIRSVDASGDFYISLGGRLLGKYEGSELLATFDTSEFEGNTIKTNGVAIGIDADQSAPAGHIFVQRRADFAEMDAGGAEVPTYSGLHYVGGGEYQPSNALAYNPTLDRVYIYDRANFDVPDSERDVVRVFGPSQTVAIPSAAIKRPARAAGDTAATFLGTVNPSGVNNDWSFEWKKLSQSWGKAESSPPQTLPADTSDHPVSFEATGLDPEAIYEVRLVVHNTDAGIPSSTKPLTFANSLPDVGIPFAAPRTDTTARINARLNPLGNPTDYHFEYRRADQVGWTELKTTHDPGTTTTALVAAELTGLEPAIAYRFRFVAENKLGAVVDERGFSTRTSAEVNGPASCPNEEVRAAQHSSSYLPDCRGLELVNQPDKNSQNAKPPGGYAGPLASAGGGTALWSVTGGAPGAHTKVAATFVAARGAAGWSSQALVPPPERQFSGGAAFYSLAGATPALSRFVLGSEDTEEDRALVGIDRSQDEQVLRIYEKGGFGLGNVTVDLSDDGAHVVALNRDTDQLEEIGGGEPAAVLSLMPGGGESECGLEGEKVGFRGPFDLHGLHGGAGTNAGHGYRMIADTDASRVYFEVAPDGHCGGLYGLYVRNREAGETTLIDPGAGSGPPEKDSPQFIRATPDGRAAYYVTSSHCRKWTQGASPSCESTETEDANGHPDVYRWQEATGESECLTCGLGGDANVLGSVLLSDDFSHLYFISKAALAPGAEAGAFNLYALGGGQARLVAELLGSSDAVRFLLSEAQLSADGEVLVFAAGAGPNLSADPVAPGLEELYRYDDRDQSLECVSCRRDGVTEHFVGGLIGHPWAMSADGGTIAFRTEEALLPGDVNGGMDVYEWRNGAVHLITDGVREFTLDPEVWSVSAEGSDIFFAAVAPGLTGFEHDGLANLYDARVGGGFEPPTPPAHCAEDSCQGPLQAAPALDQPGSANESRGNVVERASCSALDRRAARLARRARALRHQARRLRNRRAARRLRRSSARLARHARGLNKRTKRCRRANRRSPR
jgi:hypothetical protein